MKTVVLTGATGYIGQYAINFLLEKDYIVHAVSSKFIAGAKSSNPIWHQTDLLDANAVENLIKLIRPTHLLHFAWYVEHGKFWNAPENLDWLQASLFLAQKFVENGGERLVTAGTCAEYDWTSQSPFVENSTPMRPQTLYGASKFALGLALGEFAKASNISFASGKIFFPFGGNEQPNRLLPSVIRALLKNEAAKTSHGNQIRDFMYVENIAEAFVELLESKAEGIVNIASGKGFKLREIIEIIAALIGRPELLQIGAIPALPNDPPEIFASIRRLQNEVNYRKQLDLASRLKDTVDYHKKVYEIND